MGPRVWIGASRLDTSSPPPGGGGGSRHRISMEASPSTMARDSQSHAPHCGAKSRSATFPHSPLTFPVPRTLGSLGQPSSLAAGVPPPFPVASHSPCHTSCLPSLLLWLRVTVTWPVCLPVCTYYLSLVSQPYPVQQLVRLHRRIVLLLLPPFPPHITS